jgi:hypothetical protein
MRSLEAAACIKEVRKLLKAKATIGVQIHTIVQVIKLISVAADSHHLYIRGNETDIVMDG